MDMSSWAVGFLDGEGCMYMSTRSRGKNAATYYFPVLSLQISSTDEAAITRIERAIGCKAYRSSRLASKRKWNTKPTEQGNWQSKKQLKCVISFLDKNPFQTPKKSREYKIWRKAVLLYLREPKIKKRESKMERYRKLLKVARLH